MAVWQSQREGKHDIKLKGKKKLYQEHTKKGNHIILRITSESSNYCVPPLLIQQGECTERKTVRTAQTEVCPTKESWKDLAL